MDEKVRDLTKLLGQAIDQAIHESPMVKAAMERIRDAGYETILMVEANICLARIRAEAKPELADMISAEDRNFLRSLRIRVDD
ncbi:MAG: hypothetical protein RMM17_09210 [Acidobacteriota bacterium]|nr:hypothetical protein [Blastocatellia bacterium]MDW8412846.1 hypothetical protein [Acidobacteriota bacterium]